MTVCTLYILLGGGIFLTPGCVVDNGVTYPDEIVYADTLPRTYSYAPLYRPVYRPRVVYKDSWRSYRRPGRSWRRMPRRNRYYPVYRKYYRPKQHPKVLKTFPKQKSKKQNKKHFKKKK